MADRRGEAGLRADLAALGIEFEEQEHRAVFTVAESSELHDRMPGAHSKNLFLKDAGGVFWLVTVPAHARVDLKTLPQAIGSKRVSFAKAEDMERLLGITPGSVTPLAMINAAPGTVRVVLEQGLAATERVNIPRCATPPPWRSRARTCCACCATGGTSRWWRPFPSRTDQRPLVAVGSRR